MPAAARGAKGSASENKENRPSESLALGRERRNIKSTIENRDKLTQTLVGQPKPPRGSTKSTTVKAVKSMAVAKTMPSDLPDNPMAPRAILHPPQKRVKPNQTIADPASSKDAPPLSIDPFQHWHASYNLRQLKPPAALMLDAGLELSTPLQKASTSQIITQPSEATVGEHDWNSIKAPKGVNAETTSGVPPSANEGEDIDMNDDHGAAQDLSSRLVRVTYSGLRKRSRIIYESEDEYAYDNNNIEEDTKGHSVNGKDEHEEEAQSSNHSDMEDDPIEGYNSLREPRALTEDITLSPKLYLHREPSYYPGMEEDNNLEQEYAPGEEPNQQDIKDRDQRETPLYEDQQRAPVVQDVLANHHTKNPARKLPQEDRLQCAAEHQGRLSNVANNNLEEDSQHESNEEPTDSEDEAPVAKRAVRISPDEPNPTMLRFYSSSGTWKMVLVESKYFIQLYIVSESAFPHREKNLSIASSILAERIQYHIKENNIEFDPEFSHTRSMDVLIFKECATFRGKMKEICRNLVAKEKFYGKHFELPDEGEEGYIDGAHSQAEAHSVIAKQGKKSNFAHPCIRALVLEFFYKKKDSLARQFPDHFDEAVPIQALALAAICIYNCIDEYSQGMFIAIPFEGTLYADTYDNIITVLGVVKEDKYHGKKLENMLKSWAEAGM
ncbi:hypothetical protein BJ165DRAFT_1407920 [Panaeolus papilionaceus]|nr:hypothetical protein BJ165DRAFT_1407920 [Panaeolus papilionaceus]